MEVYTDYQYYTSVYGGSAIAEADFPRLARLACLYLDTVTLGRAARWPDRDLIETAACALAEQYQIIDTAAAAASAALIREKESGGAEAQSESVGKWSVSYRSGGDSAAKALTAAASAKNSLMETAELYLGASGLMKARGASCDCYRIL